MYRIMRCSTQGWNRIDLGSTVRFFPSEFVMMPPCCAVCDAVPPADMGEFRTVSFADLKPLPPGRSGHPDGLVWFCPKHLELARTLTHLGSLEALKRIRDSGTTG